MSEQLPGNAARDYCRCVGYSAGTRPARVAFHTEVQDTDAPGWRRLLELIDEAAADGRTEFVPARDMSPAERKQVITLPPSIGTLTRVKSLVLYGSNLVRIRRRSGR